MGVKELPLNTIFFGRVWWSMPPNVTKFGQCLLCESVAECLKELILEGVVVLEHMGDGQGSIGDIKGGV